MDSAPVPGQLSMRMPFEFEEDVDIIPVDPPPGFEWLDRVVDHLEGPSVAPVPGSSGTSNRQSPSIGAATSSAGSTGTATRRSGSTSTAACLVSSSRP